LDSSRVEAGRKPAHRTDGPHKGEGWGAISEGLSQMAVVAGREKDKRKEIWEAMKRNGSQTFPRHFQRKVFRSAKLRQKTARTRLRRGLMGEGRWVGEEKKRSCLQFCVVGGLRFEEPKGVRGGSGELCAGTAYC